MRTAHTPASVTAATHATRRPRTAGMSAAEQGPESGSQATVTIATSSGTPEAATWGGVCAVDAAAYGPQAWSVQQPGVEQAIAQHGFVLATASAGLSIVGFASAVPVTAACAQDVLESGYEERTLTAADLLPCPQADHWYVTSVCLLPGWHRRGLGTRLLAGALDAVAGHARGYDRVHVIGQIWSDGGRATFARFGAQDAGVASMRVSTAPADLAARARTLA